MVWNPATNVVPIVIAAAQKRVLDHFRNAGAISPATAIPPPDRKHLMGRLDHLVKKNVIVEATPGHYYLDETELARRQAKERPIIIAIVVVVVLLAAIAIVIGANR